jgi:hypothetical protein
MVGLAASTLVLGLLPGLVSGSNPGSGHVEQDMYWLSIDVPYAVCSADADQVWDDEMKDYVQGESTRIGLTVEGTHATASCLFRRDKGGFIGWGSGFCAIIVDDPDSDVDAIYAGEGHVRAPGSPKDQSHRGMVSITCEGEYDPDI